MAKDISPGMASQLLRKANGPSVNGVVAEINKKVDDLIKKFKGAEDKTKPNSREATESRELFVKELTKSLNLDDTTIHEQAALMEKIQKETHITLTYVEKMATSWSALAKSSFIKVLSSPASLGRVLSSALKLGGFFAELGKTTFAFIGEKLKSLTPSLIKNVIGGAIDSIKNVASRIFAFLQNPFAGILSAIRKFFDPLIRAFYIALDFAKKMVSVLVSIITFVLNLTITFITFLFTLTTAVITAVFSIATAVIAFTFSLVTVIATALFTLTLTVITFALTLALTVITFALSLVTLIATALFALTLTVITLVLTLAITILAITLTFFFTAILIALQLAAIAGLLALVAAATTFIAIAMLIPVTLLTLGLSLLTFTMSVITLGLVTATFLAVTFVLLPAILGVGIYLFAVITPLLTLILAASLISATGAILIIALVLFVGFLLYKSWKYLSTLYDTYIEPAFAVVRDFIYSTLEIPMKIWEFLKGFFDNCIAPAFDKVGEWLFNIGNMLGKAFDFLLTLPVKVVDWVTVAVSTWFSWLKTGWATLYGWIEQIFNWVNPIEMGKRAAAFAAKTAKDLGNSIKSGLNNFASSLWPFADGGIVTGPTRALVAEAGTPEAIIPLNSSGMEFIRNAFSLDQKAMSDLMSNSPMYNLLTATHNIVEQTYDATTDIHALLNSNPSSPIIFKSDSPEVSTAYSNLDAIVLKTDNSDTNAKSKEDIILEKIEKLTDIVNSIEIPTLSAVSSNGGGYSDLAAQLSIGRLGKRK